jgi:DNA modification methylase
MVGSGTTAVEAALCGRRAMGVDIDPLALRLAGVKTTRFDLAQLRETVERVVAEARRKVSDTASLERKIDKQFDAEERGFIDYWFSRPAQLQLMALLHGIAKVTDEVQRAFLELTFSSVIVTKSGGVSQARDLAHSRPHRDEDKPVKNAIDQFALRAQKNLSSLTVMRQCRFRPRIIPGDARSLTLRDQSVDLIVTSPPYANAIDYMRAHKFSLVWLGDSLPMLTELRAQYIGSERLNGTVPKRLPREVELLLDQLQSLDSKKGSILRKYFGEMESVAREMHRVLRAGRCAIMVVGSSTMRGMDVQTHLCLAQIAHQVGFDVIGTSRRQLDRNHRMMPARFGTRNGTGIENRMHDEYVIGLLKTAR